MPIHFTEEQWARVRERYALWWEGRLAEPLVKVTAWRAHAPEGAPPKAPLLSQASCADFSFTPDEVVEAIDYELSQYEFLGDAYPFVSFDTFGPGVLAAFCGARLDNSSGRVWFFPPEGSEGQPIEELHIRYDPENIWVKRVKALYRAAQRRWGGQVLLSLPDLGGPTDVVATFRTSEGLLLELYDSPDEVLRLCREAEDAWLAAYEDLMGTLMPVNPGYSDWSGIYSAVPSVIMQSDFSYMIGTPMFDRYVLPGLRRFCKVFPHSIYHLDGVGELNHLEHILAIEELDAVQWVYGDGKPSARHWPEVYQRIADAGKGVWMIGDAEDYAALAPIVKKGMYAGAGADSLAEAEELLKRFQRIG